MYIVTDKVGPDHPCTHAQFELCPDWSSCADPVAGGGGGGGGAEGPDPHPWKITKI